MKKMRLVAGILVSIIFASCDKDNQIRNLLDSKNPYEVIKGCSEAAETGNKAYIPLMLRNCGDERRTTDLRFKGYTVYQEKMYVLQELLKARAPDSITYKKDSINIKFFIKCWESYQKKNISLR